MTGACPHGQGEETTFAQIAADELGVGLDDILVLRGDTAIVQYGIGTFGSRATAVGGTALYYALQDLKAKIKKFGVMLLESEDVTLTGGKVVCNKTGNSKSFQEIAGASYRALKLPPNTEPGLIATKFWEPPNFTFPFGAHIVVTDIDGETGQLITGELMDYAVPRSHMMPWIESHHTCTPSPVNPLGVKGVGEAGTIGCSPAVVNSVVDALSPLGVRHIDMPLTPEKIWKLVQGAHA